MTWRAVILGFAGVVFLCSFDYVNDNILRQTYLIGHSLPFAIYGTLIVVAAGINPLLKRFAPRLALRGSELALILCMVLSSCCIPASGLLRTFTTSLMLPYQYNKVNPGWRERQVLKTLPPRMLADPSGNEDRALNGFVQGLGTPKRNIRIWEVPWSAWWRTLLFWVPLILSAWLGLLALAAVLHRQWAHHELVPYPIAEFADSLLPPENGIVSPLLRNRLFWLGTGLILALHLNNFLTTFFPHAIIPIHRRLELGPLARFIPFLQAGGGTRLLNPAIYFTVVGFAFFIPTDVSLSIGIGPFLWAIVMGFFAGYGISLRAPVEGAGGAGLSAYLSLRPQSFVQFGAYLAVFAIVCYCGRHYYWQVIRDCFRRRLRSGQGHGFAVWGMRLFLLCFGLFWVQLTVVGLDWQLGLAYLAVYVIFYVVMSRIYVETGLFYIQPFFFPSVVIWGLLGSRALGLQPLVIMFMLGTVLLIDPRESLMPFVVNSFRLLEKRKVKLPRSAWLFAGAVILGLAVALPVTLYFQYDLAYAKWDGWAGRMVPQMAFNNIAAIGDRLAAQGSLHLADSLSGFRRLTAWSPSLPCLWAMLAGLLLASLFYAGRLRFPWWPIHPVLFLTWAAEPTWRLCGSFLIGWLAKVAVVRYGGATGYARARPLFLGMVAGEILGALVPTVVGAVYYVVTGLPPHQFWVLPMRGI